MAANFWVAWDWICGFDVGFEILTEGGLATINLGIISILIVFDSQVFEERVKERYDEINASKNKTPPN